MAITINVNGLTLVHKGSEGVAKATLPNICLTPVPGGPPVPINYSNTAYSKDLDKGTVTITADGDNMCAHRGSEFSKSTGDEAGVLGGIFSGTHSAEATWLTWSPDVFLEGKNACRLTDKMLMNHGNTACLAGGEQPNIEELVEKFRECAEANELYERAKKANDDKDPEIVKGDGSHRAPATTDSESGKITIDYSVNGNPLDEFDLLTGLCFELSNRVKLVEFQDVQDKYFPKERGMRFSSNREAFARNIEKIEFGSCKETEKIFDACKEQLGYKDRKTPYDNYGPMRFNYYWEKIKNSEHTEGYREAWDRIFNLLNPKK